MCWCAVKKLLTHSLTANRQSETGFPSSHQLKSYVASKSRLKLAARGVLSADAGLLVFVCYSNILGTAECFCTKFTGKTCLVPRSDKFECQGQRSRSPGTNREKLLSHPRLTVHCKVCAVLCKWLQQQMRPFCGCRGWQECTVMGTFGGLRAVYVRWNIFSSSLAISFAVSGNLVSWCLHRAD